MKNEDWKDVVGFEGYYQVSNLGNVRGLDRMLTRSDKAKPYKQKGKMIVAKGLPKTGHRHLRLSRDHTWKVYLVHRLVAIHFIPNPDNKPEVNHIDGNPSNNNVTNLEWVTRKENVRHYFDVLGGKSSMKGRFGNEHNRSKGYVRKSERLAN